MAWKKAESHQSARARIKGVGFRVARVPATLLPRAYFEHLRPVQHEDAMGGSDY